MKKKIQEQGGEEGRGEEEEGIGQEKKKNLGTKLISGAKWAGFRGN